MFLPIRSKNPPESLPVVTCVLITLNSIIFLLTTDGFVIREGVLNQFGEKSSNLSLLTAVSSMFLHGNIEHLIGNMWFLYLFGFAVEGRLKSLKFAAVYFGAGICGSLLHHFLFGRFNPDIPSIGASGAIMGVMGAALYMFPHAKIQFLYTWLWVLQVGIVDIAMWIVGLIYVGLDVLFAALAGHTGDGVGHFAHLGGVLGGILICALMHPRRDNAEVSDAKAILTDTKDLGTLSVYELGQLYHSNPGDTTVLLNWMVQSMNSNRMSDECNQEFMKSLPAIMKEQPTLAVASCITSLANISDLIHPALLADIAGRVERTGNPTFALNLYTQALRDSRLSVEDEECCLFRGGLINETRLLNKGTAINWYQELIRRHPQSSWADQAKVRLSTLGQVP